MGAAQYDSINQAFSFAKHIHFTDSKASPDLSSPVSSTLHKGPNPSMQKLNINLNSIPQPGLAVQSSNVAVSAVAEVYLAATVQTAKEFW